MAGNKDSALDVKSDSNKDEGESRDELGCPSEDGGLNIGTGDSSSDTKSDSIEDGSPNVGTGDPTDGRHHLEWESKYPPNAVRIIRLEALYLVALFFLSFVLYFITWRGLLEELLNISSSIDANYFRQFCYFAISGLLGGTIFGIKYLYRVVARGYWHMDRQLWRFLTPLMSFALAFVVGALFDSELMSKASANDLMLSGHNETAISGTTAISIGFLVGYFADQVVAKLYEIASVIFGTTSKPSRH